MSACKPSTLVRRRSRLGERGSGAGTVTAGGCEVRIGALLRHRADHGRGRLSWLPVRRTLGVEAFGINAYVAAETGEPVVEEHTEQNLGHEEVYVVLTGRATFTLDGETLDAPAGTAVFVREPAVHRGTVAAEPATSVLAIGGEAREPYSPSAWEWYFAAERYRPDADYDGALKLLAEGLERFPDNAGMLYSVACWESLAGRTDEALGHLRRALELDPGFAKMGADGHGSRPDPCPGRFPRLRSGGRAFHSSADQLPRGRPGRSVRRSSPRHAFQAVPSVSRSVRRSAPSAWRSGVLAVGTATPRSRMQPASRPPLERRAQAIRVEPALLRRPLEPVGAEARDGRGERQGATVRAHAGDERLDLLLPRQAARLERGLRRLDGREAPLQVDPVLRHAAAPCGALRLLGGSSGDGDAGRDCGQGDDDGDDEDRRAARHAGAHGSSFREA